MPRKKTAGDASAAAQSAAEGLAVPCARGSVKTKAPADAEGQQSADCLSGAPQNDPGFGRITRSTWPDDEAERLKAVAAIMPQALADYYGNSVVIAANLHLLPSEVDEVIQANPKLVRAQQVFQNAVMAQLEDVLIWGAIKERNHTTAKYVLERLDSERWGKKKPDAEAEETAKASPVPTSTPPPVYKRESPE